MSARVGSVAEGWKASGSADELVSERVVPDLAKSQVFNVPSESWAAVTVCPVGRPESVRWTSPGPVSSWPSWPFQ